MRLHLDDILALEQRYRANLMNALSGFKSANLIGTADAAGRSNLAIFNSVQHIGANPPLLGFISRPASVERHTLSNILATEHYTINHVHHSFFRQAHQTSARYDGSEFEATGLGEAWLAGFPAPFVREARIKMGLRLREQIPIRSNDTLLVIGEVQWLFLPDGLIAPDGKADIEAAGTVAISGLDGYHRTQQLARLSYAKPDVFSVDI